MMVARQAAKAPAEKVIAGEGTGQQDGEFDLDAWLGQATRPEREVTLFAANALQADIDRLERDRVAALAAGGHVSWGAPDGGVDTARIDAELEEVRGRLAASGLTLRVQCIDSDDLDAINHAHPMSKGADDDEVERVMGERILAMVAKQIREPREFAVEEVRALRKAVGDPEFMKLVNAAQETRSETAASSPFWRGSSGTARS